MTKGVTTVEASFYDSAMVEEGAPSMLPLADSPWRHLYQEAASWIPPSHPVCDLGTGTGRFPHQLRWCNHYGPIVGIDFSQAALAQARSYLDANFVADVDLDQADLREWQPDADRPGNTTYTCLEVLEHLNDDLSLVRRIPPGHQFVFSVPSFESEAHVRVFRNAGDIWARYANLLTFRRWSLIHVNERKAIHAVDAFRRTDAW